MCVLFLFPLFLPCAAAYQALSPLSWGGAAFFPCKGGPESRPGPMSVHLPGEGLLRSTPTLSPSILAFSALFQVLASLELCVCRGNIWRCPFFMLHLDLSHSHNRNCTWRVMLCVLWTSQEVTLCALLPHRRAGCCPAQVLGDPGGKIHSEGLKKGGVGGL